MHQDRSRGARGFTLLELIVVIAIIGLLSTIAAVKVIPVLMRSNDAKIEADLRTIVTTSESLYVLAGSYPATIDDMIDPQAADGSPLPGLKEKPFDPWGAEYAYEVGPRGPLARCLGKDGVEGGEGDDRDHVHPGGKPARAR